MGCANTKINSGTEKIRWGISCRINQIKQVVIGCPYLNRRYIIEIFINTLSRIYTTAAYITNFLQVFSIRFVASNKCEFKSLSAFSSLEVDSLYGILHLYAVPPRELAGPGENFIRGPYDVIISKQQDEKPMNSTPNR